MKMLATTLVMPKNLGPRRPFFKESGARPESSGDGRALSCSKCVEMGEARMKFGLRWKNDGVA
jgi:hypothetical protein